MGKRETTIQRLSFITLQYAKAKGCDRHPRQYVRVQINEPGKVCLNVKGDAPDDKQAGGALVVVCDGESPLHGEGAQLNQFVSANYLTPVR